MTPRAGVQAPLVVLDDDPTGTQAVADTPVLLDWEGGLPASLAAAPALHLLTNSRALPAQRAKAAVRRAVAAALAAFDSPRLLLRGDSTLRGHVLEEYAAVVEVQYGNRPVPLLLVPALPAAGRVTVGGVHLIARDGVRQPLHETEYSRDPAFAYSSARLLEWAEERSRGYFRRERGRELGRPEPNGVRDAILELQGLAGVVVPDAETIEDLEAIAAGLRAAERAGAEVVVRAAPTFAGVLGGNLARAPAPAPRGRRVLVVCGSYVPATTRQLARVLERHPRALVEVDVVALASEAAAAETARAVREVETRLRGDGLAVVATARERPAALSSLEAGAQIADNLARIAGAVEAPDVVIAKGGITSAVTARLGFGARCAVCLGPIVDGVALWTLDRGLPYVVFPGNVGSDSTLLDVVELVRDAAG